MLHLRCWKPKLLLLFPVLSILLLAVACNNGDPTPVTIPLTKISGPTDVPPTQVPTATAVPTNTPIVPVATTEPVDPREATMAIFLENWNRSCASQGYSPCPLTEQDLPPLGSDVSAGEAQMVFMETWNVGCGQRGYVPCPLMESHLP